jgi:hypothetical protein
MEERHDDRRDYVGCVEGKGRCLKTSKGNRAEDEPLYCSRRSTREVNCGGVVVFVETLRGVLGGSLAVDPSMLCIQTV